MKKVKKIAKKHVDKNTILEYLRLLEENEMKISFIAKRVGVDRSTIFRWKRKYWGEYLIRENEIKNQLDDIDEVKKRNVKEFDVLKGLFTKVLKLAINRIIEILSDSELVKTLSHKDLIQFINVASPYCVEKVGLSGADNSAETMEERHNAFVQNIVRQMNIKGYRKLQENDKKKDQT